MPANFSNELLPIPTADFPPPPSAAAEAVLGGAREDAKDHLGGSHASADTPVATAADTVVWKFESAHQLAVMTLNAPLTAIRELGDQGGASILLRTCQREANVPLIQVKATKRQKRKRDDERAAEAKA